MKHEEITIGISASYNIERNPYEEAAKKYLKDIENNSALQTIPLYRSQVLGIDNLKFLYTLSGVPIIAHTVLNALSERASGKDVNVRVVGNDEVGRLISLLNNELDENMEFVHEGAKLSLSNSLEKLFEGETTAQNYFVTGDIPYARGYTDSGYFADLTFDLNSHRLSEKLDSVKRNFYSKGKIGDEEHMFKEPNIFHFREEGYMVLKDFSDIFYENRKSGGLPNAMYEYFSKRVSVDKEFSKRVMINLGKGYRQIINMAMQKGRFTRNIAAPINFNVVNDVASSLFEIDFEFRFTHRDIFRMLDIDGLNNDWIMYEMISRRLERRGNQDDRLTKLQAALKDKTTLKEFPLIENLEEVIKEYTLRIDEHLPADKKISFTNLKTFFQRNSQKEVVEDLTRLLV